MDDSTQQLKFLVFDALMVDSKNLLNRDLSRRLGVSTCSRTSKKKKKRKQKDNNA